MFEVQTNGGPQKTQFVNLEGIKMLLTRTRSPYAVDLAHELGIQIHESHWLPVEASVIRFLVAAFANEVSFLQYSVGQERIDLYFPDYKLAVEVDETHHDHPANREADAAREERIKAALGCTFLRIRCRPGSIDLAAVVNQVYRHISDALQNGRNAHPSIRHRNHVLDGPGSLPMDTLVPSMGPGVN
jgi:very-short-patch-repair endonuclease